MHEIVTLQFGNQSNYLGTHFWNTQESYFTYSPEPESPVDHDILFRPGTAPDGSDTFTPRTLIYDLKSSFGSMRKINALYEPEDDGSLDQPGVWRSKPIIQRAAPIPQSSYQTHLDAGLEPPPLNTSSVRYWSDYSRVFYHPRSLVQLSEFDVNDSLVPFEKWHVGMDLFEKLEREEDLVDRDLRPFAEECDGLQGLQVITGIDDAWGGWASAWLERLRDDYGKLSIWTWGIGDQGGNMSATREKRMQQIENSSRSLHALAEHSSVYIPLSNKPATVPSYVSLDYSSPWHVGAFQAVAFESVTLSCRLRSPDVGGRLQNLEEIFNSTGKRRVAKLELSVADPNVLAEKSPAHIPQAEKVEARISQSSGDVAPEQLSDFDIDVFTKDYRIGLARPKKHEHVFGRAEASRGDWDLADDRDPRARLADEPTVQRFSAPLLFPLLDSFPASVFDVGSGEASKLAVHSGLTTSTAVANQVRIVEQIVRRMHLISVDEREAICNGLQTLAEEYDEGWDSGSDSNDDE